MTLIVATVADDGVWMGGDRQAGPSVHGLMAGPKVTRHATPDGTEILLGFAGSARVAQRIRRVEPPARGGWSTVEAWVTVWCDTVYTACADVGLVTDGDDGPSLAGWTACLLAVEGRLFHIGSGLYWHEPACGWSTTGSAAETFDGAWLVLREHHDPVTAARYAWPFAQRMHPIGPLADELTLGS